MLEGGAGGGEQWGGGGQRGRHRINLIFKDQSKKFKVGIRFADELVKYFAFSSKSKNGT